MSNSLVVTSQVLAERGVDLATWSALKNSIYPGAKDDSVLMALDYCRARQLDPLMKPVHLVPMYIKDSKTGKGEMRDVVMPGVGLYRIQADRSGNYAGADEPVFGPDITQVLNGVEVIFPQWCKYTVHKRMPSGEIVAFSAKEYWSENYATAGRDNIAPNAMWKKRPYGQLAKCAEAQALRKGWPEIGQQPTAEEMEGKNIDLADVRDVTPQAESSSDVMATSATLQEITDMLTALDKDWDNDFLPLCRTIFKREIMSADQLTEAEAQRGFDFLKKKAEGSK